MVPQRPTHGHGAKNLLRALAGGVGAQAAVDSLSRQLRFDLNLLFFGLFEIMISAECENQFSRLSPSSLFFLDCRERVVPPGPPLPGLVRKGSLRGEEEEGEIQQCEERLLFLCDTLSNALSRDTANPTKLAQVCLKFGHLLPLVHLLFPGVRQHLLLSGGADAWPGGAEPPLQAQTRAPSSPCHCRTDRPW